MFQVVPENLLEDISSTVINDMVSSLASKDVTKIDAALRAATGKVRPQLQEYANLKSMSIREAARLVSKQVAKDKRLLQALAERQGKVATRSLRNSLSNYVDNIVFTNLAGL